MWVYEGRYLVINVPWVTLRLFGPVFFFFVVSCEGVLSGVDSWLVLGVPWLAFVLLFEVSSWRMVELESILIKKWYLSFRNPDVNYVWTALWLGSTCSRSSFTPPHIFYQCLFNPFLVFRLHTPNQWSILCFLMHGRNHVSSCYSQMVIQDESFSSPFTPLSPLGWKGANNTYFFDLLINYKLVTRCSCRHWS